MELLKVSTGYFQTSNNQQLIHFSVLHVHTKRYTQPFLPLQGLKLELETDAYRFYSWEIEVHTRDSFLIERKQRLLWIGHMKEGNTCVLSKLPKEVIKYITFICKCEQRRVSDLPKYEAIQWNFTGEHSLREKQLHLDWLPEEHSVPLKVIKMRIP